MFLIVILGLSWTGGRYVLKKALLPLSRLQQPLSELASGNMRVQFSPSRHEEIQNIIKTLERTTRALGERDRRLSHLATHDSLTGLLNRHAFVQELTHEVERLAGRGKQSAILFIDLDQFKYINDTCGHPAGDELLRIAARSVKATARDNDLVARFGGDEFAVLARNVTRAQARAIGEKILQQMALLTQVHEDKVFHLQCSIGIAMVRSSALDAHEFLSQADIACHAAKENGRNRVEIYKASRKENQQMANEIVWVERIRRALDRDGFVLVYQPLLRISTGWTDHHEVLLRLKTDDDELVSPDAFLPAAKRFGLMVDIDHWVLENAIKSLAEHRTPRTNLNYSINLSASVFENERFGKHVQSLLARYDVPPESIIFEITEQTAVRFAAESDKQIALLREVGCRFAIDDFGKGYSSFSYLRDLPVDYLKIDGSFVEGLEHDEMNQTLVRAMGEVARAARLETIAECVETGETLALLGQLGIDYAQGHFIAKPALAPTELEIQIPRVRDGSKRMARGA
jgi:diguanylate cyclase (GGDEF)-like protein